MTEYKVVAGKRGKRYFKNSKFISADKILISVLERLTPDNPVTIKECLFCGAESKLERLVVGQSLALCNEHYYGKTIGQIVNKLREEN